MSKSNTDIIDLEKELDKLIAELTTSVSVKKKKRIKESGKKYYGKNKDKIKQRLKKFREENPEYFKKYREKNKETMNAISRRWYNENKERAHELVKNYDLNDRISILNERKDIRKFLSLADIFVLSSHQEGLSNGLLEAMSMEIPCIVSNIQANTEIIIDEYNGFIFNRFDPNDLMDKILKIQINNKNYNNIVINAKTSIVQNYDMKSVAQRYTHVYHQLINY